jgi:hypothetical protein
MTNTSYLSVTETAKLVRAALKKAFPGVKFSVRSDSYAGGASIDVGWTDGPTGKEVDAVIKMYEGGGFDGMQDLAYSYSHWLMPDGSTVLASSTHNFDGGVINEKPHPDAVPIQFGADYVFGHRKFSPALMVTAATELFAAAGLDLDPMAAVKVHADGTGYWAPELNGVRLWDDWVTTQLHRAMVGLRGDGTRTHDLHAHEIRDEAEAFATALTATIEGSIH